MILAITTGNGVLRVLREGETMIYQVECDNGHCYTQETEPIRDESHLRPYVCGACGSKGIKVWALVYGDVRGMVIDVDKRTPTIGYGTRHGWW